VKEAMFWKKIDDSAQCGLCAHNCRIAENCSGFCSVRKNIGGKLFSLVYGKASSIAVDPVEKKPFFHFAPGSRTLSISTVGCNFRCDFCQNYEISQAKEIFGQEILPEKIVEMVKAEDAPGISWTYTEPTVFFEYFYDTAKLCHEQKLNYYQTWVTNGYTTTEALSKTAKYLDAVNVDYKGSDEFYRTICSATLEPVRTALREYKKLGIWIEITNLLIPGHNDSDETIKEMVDWIANNLGQVPLHFSRFFPYHKLKADITPTETLERAAKIAGERLDYVYIGNVKHEKENTYCHNCKALIIERTGFLVVKVDVKKKGKDYHCPNCSAKIPLAGMQWTSKVEGP
jgi:pyruvate formate lyase activating enzyme